MLHRNPLSVLHASNWLVPEPALHQQSSRKIPKQPDKMLDAPDIIDDYYLNILSWSSKNILAVALRDTVYLWNAATSSITLLMQTSEPGDYVSAVRWSPDGHTIAIGTAASEISLWDAEYQKFLQNLHGHELRVSSLSWNPAAHSTAVTSGGRDALILSHDLRARRSARAPSRSASASAAVRRGCVRVGGASAGGHTQEVCGLQWSPSGVNLASGGNDNLLNIWDGRYLERDAKFRLEHHTAAVKAIAWCPWQNGLLASGGGTADRSIRFWNTSTGACLNCVDTKSQVCAIQWSSRHRELVSSHGFSHNQLILWKYPTMTKLAEFTGHTSRVLHLEKSPDGLTVVSAAGDETIRFWKVWDTDETSSIIPGLSPQQSFASPRKRSRSSISSPSSLR